MAARHDVNFIRFAAGKRFPQPRRRIGRVNGKPGRHALPQVILRDGGAPYSLVSFNHDFQVTLDESAGQVSYNYRPEPGLLGGEQSTEMPVASCFLRDGGETFHTYSAYARSRTRRWRD
jgi:hypothetical protein